MRVFGDPRVGYALFAVAAAAVLVGSVVSAPAAVVDPVVRPLGVPLDKWVHAATYAVLAVLLCHALRARTARTVLLAVAVVAVYGLAIEVVQATVPARTFDLLDAAANATGAGLAALAWWVGVTRDERRAR